MTEEDFPRIAIYTELALGAATILAVSFITAPYGRHTRKGFGPAIPQRLAWVLMEAPAVLVWGAIYLMGDHRAEAAPLAMVSLWMLHYVQRTFVFPPPAGESPPHGGGVLTRGAQRSGRR